MRLDEEDASSPLTEEKQQSRAMMKNKRLIALFFYHRVSQMPKEKILLANNRLRR